jgi:hypothetical protein
MFKFYPQSKNILSKVYKKFITFKKLEEPVRTSKPIESKPEKEMFNYNDKHTSSDFKEENYNSRQEKNFKARDVPRRKRKPIVLEIDILDKVNLTVSNPTQFEIISNLLKSMNVNIKTHTMSNYYNPIFDTLIIKQIFATIYSKRMVENRKIHTVIIVNDVSL